MREVIYFEEKGIMAKFLIAKRIGKKKGA